MKNLNRFLSNGLLITVMASCFSSCLASKSIDRQMGAQADQEVAVEFGIASHRASKEYLSLLGARLVKNLDKPDFEYQFNIIDREEPNAFALPGGYIYFSRGLLLLANSEDELAGVVGHEIIHSHRRHAIKGIRRGVIPGLLHLPGNLVGFVLKDSWGRAINTPIKAATGLFTSRYSRSQETEADTFGIQLAADAGYNPSAMGVLLTNIEKEDQRHHKEEQVKFSFYDDHPYTPDRVKNMEKVSQEIEKNQIPPITKTRAEFLKKFEGFIIGPSPTQGFFQENVFIQPDLKFRIEFPKKWMLDNTPTHVLATNPDKKAQIILGIEPKARDPQLAAHQFLDELKRKKRIMPDEARPVEINGNPGYYVSLTDKKYKEKVAIHLLWVSINDVMIKVIGTGYPAHKEIMKASVSSIKKMSESELKNIQMMTLQIGEAFAGEDLKKFSTRVGNLLDLETTALINNLDMNVKLTGNSLLKIGKKKPFY